MSEDDSDLPLHDEAKARSKWRGGETLIGRDGGGDSGPASEIDNAGSGGGGENSRAHAEDRLAQRPPD